MSADRPLTRRDFLKTVAIGTAALLLPGCDTSGTTLPIRDIKLTPEAEPKPVWQINTQKDFLMDKSNAYVHDKSGIPAIVDLKTGNIEEIGDLHSKIAHVEDGEIFIANYGGDMDWPNILSDAGVLDQDVYFGPLRSIDAIDIKTKQKRWNYEYPLGILAQDERATIIFEKDKKMFVSHSQEEYVEGSGMSGYVLWNQFHILDEATGKEIISAENHGGDVLDSTKIVEGEDWIPYESTPSHYFVNSKTAEIVVAQGEPLAVKGNVGFIGTFSPDATNTVYPDSLEVMDLDTQEILWEMKIPGGIYSYDLHFYDNIVIISSENSTKAHNIKTGEKVWQVNERYSLADDVYSVSGVDDGKKTSIKRIDPLTGKQLWETKVDHSDQFDPDFIYSSFYGKDISVAFVVTAKATFAVNPQTGKVFEVVNIADFNSINPIITDSVDILPVGNTLLSFDKSTHKFSLLVKYDSRNEVITNTQRSGDYLLVEIANKTDLTGVSKPDRKLYCYKIPN